MKGSWIGRNGSRLAAAAFVLAGMSAHAGAQDFNNFKGDQSRTGKSTSFNGSGPGKGLLNWFHPNGVDGVGLVDTIDNQTMPNPVTDPAYNLGTGIWNSPDPAAEASAAFSPTDLFNPPAGVQYVVATTVTAGSAGATQTLASTSGILAGDILHFNVAGVDATVQSVTDATTVVLSASVGSTTGEAVIDTSARPDYAYSQCIASAVGSDPRVPLNPADQLSVWTWTLRDPTAPFYEIQNYAVYAYLPTGSTTIAGQAIFPQRYYVYEVDYAGGSFIDVVDTNKVSGGLVRLGNAGSPTDRLFPSDGLTPITVKLYNTVPRNEAGVLTTNPSQTGPDLDPALPRPLVYADMARGVPAVGFYAATPIVSSFAGAVRTVAALNVPSITTLNGEPATNYQAVVTSYEYNTGNRAWQFSPTLETTSATTVDNLSATLSLGSEFTSQIAAANYQGTDYYAAPIDVSGSTVTYAPTMNDASYDIYVWLPGDSNGEAFGHGVTFEVHEGSGVGGVQTDFTIDESRTAIGATKGWVRIGSRSFVHNHTLGNDLSLVITNTSTDPTDGPATRKAFADAVKFVGPANLQVLSTPIQTTVNMRTTPFGPIAPHAVVIVAAENGVIYCLDATGRGDGSTDILWTYPSTRDPSIPLPPQGQPDTWLDPNLEPDPTHTGWGNVDGTSNQRRAEMPQGFGLTSPVIATVSGTDYLYIASSNGRVYCIDMTGRGDEDLVNRKPGTTRRVWTYPNDFPGPTVPSTLKAFVGSVAFANTPGTPTVYVPSMQGRLYALDAAGDPINHVTSVHWTYPDLTAPVIGPISTTPAVDFNEVFFGTEGTDLNSPGQFLAVDWNSNALKWSMTGSTNPLEGFHGGPATVDAADLGGGMSDTVFVSNDNRGLYALDAGTGAIEWETYEPTAAITAPLTYTIMNVFDTGGAQVPTPVVVAPQSDGRVSVFHAQTLDVTLTGGRFAQGYDTQSQSLTSSVAVGWNFMYFGDNAGYLYAFNDGGTVFPPGTPLPITPVAGGNNPGNANYANASIRLIKKSAFIALRNGTMYYADAIDPVNQLVRSPMAFEWGETIYLLVSNFPYQTTGLPTPPVINVNFSMDGETLRNVFTEARQFPDITDPNVSNSGYGVLSFTIQPAGANALPPGPGQITVGFNTTDATGSPVNFPSGEIQKAFVANPLALDIPGWNGGGDQNIGYTNNTSDADNLLNGDPLLKASALGTVGTVAHGQNGNIKVGVIDRSLVELIRGPGHGLQNVRVERGNLLWQTDPTPGAGSPLKPLDPALFPGFEDLPTQYPNTSLDYPDILRQQVTVTKGAQDNAENPVGYGVELVGPTASDGSQMTEDNASTRALLPTSFDFTVGVPRFQPPNEKAGFDLNNPATGTASVPAGYTGTYYVYVDTSGNGVLDRPNSFIQTDSQSPDANREAFRSFALAAAVSPDIRFATTTTTLDLGTLAEGAGYSPNPPGPSNLAFDPWTGAYSTMFKGFDVVNEGNVNLLDLRLVKSTTTTTGTGTVIDPWQILSPANEDFAYIDGTYDLWSDMDPAYAPMHVVTPIAPVIGQKSRVGDRFPRKVTTNPFPRLNPYLGITAETGRVPGYALQSPRVAVTIPFGFPVGTYVGLLKVVEKDPVPGTSPDAMSEDFDANDNPLEPFSDPGLRITFKVREARVTSTMSPLDAPFVENNVTGTEAFRHSNLQPSGFRHPTNGSIVDAWSSDRGSFAAPAPGSAVVNNQWRIYVASVEGIDPKDAPGTSPLRDLNALVPDGTNNRWFQQSTQTANGFPDPSLDAAIWGPDLMGDATTGTATAKYGSPVFPANGMLDPFRDMSVDTSTPFPNALMAFVGEARVKIEGGTTTKSEIFVAPVTVDSGGATGLGDITAMTNDADASKGRPSILQTQNGFVLFYSATVGGRSNIYYVMPNPAPGASRYDGSYFGDSTALDLGEGFESVSSPSVTGRTYRGAGTSAPATGDKIIDLTFTGKLRGRPISEVFYGRMGLDVNLAPTGFLNLPVRTRETVFTGSEAGTFLADGVRWVTTSPITLELLRNGVFTDIEKPGTRQTERGTGIVTFDTLLGGKAYLDPTMGTIRLSGSMPPHDAALVLTYQPRLLRVSEGTAAGYASPTLAVDERYIPDITYWRKPDGSDADPTDPIRAGRYLFTYARAAAGSGQAARPMMKSMRFGVDLPLPVFSSPDGTIGAITITKTDPLDGGTLQFYQVDPAKKKIYFTPDDEDRAVRITYEAADEGTGADAGPRTVDATIEMITERPEELIPLDQATNEANFSMFLDPFDHADLRRPGLVWMLWSSTRAGAPDIYMQTIAPRFTPLIAGK